MFDAEYRWTLDLRLLTPLHIGSGEERLDPRGDESEDRKRVALVQRDVAGRPYLPGSTLKGALRALDPDPGSEEARRLWGEINQEGGGRQGRLTVHGAPAEEAEAFVSSHVRIDPATGAAADGLLFFREMIGPGARLAPRLTLRTLRVEPDPDEQRLLKHVSGLLGRLTSEGLRLGSGVADGDGWLEVAGIQGERRLWRGDRFVSESWDPPVQQRPVRSSRHPAWRVELRCDGPYRLGDGAVHRKEAGDGEAAQLRPFRLPDGRIWTMGSSISGALRARTSWLGSLEALRSGARPEDAREAGAALARRLFGSTDRRAHVTLRDLQTAVEGTETLTSVRLDRFSAAPVSGALFTAEAAVGASVSFLLTYDGPDEDKPAVERLLADIAEQGLQLGSGGGRGFGWFSAAIHEEGQRE